MQGIEEALKILFPNCDFTGGDDVDLAWEDLSGDEDDEEEEERDDDIEVDEDGLLEEAESDEEVIEREKKVKPRMRVNPKTGESEIQADMELDKVPTWFEPGFSAAVRMTLP